MHTVDRRPVAWIIRFTDELKCEHPRSDVKREHPHSLATCRSSGSSISQRVWRRLTLKQESLRQQSIVIICVWIVFSPRKVPVRGLRFHPSSRIPRTIPRGGGVYRCRVTIPLRHDGKKTNLFSKDTSWSSIKRGQNEPLADDDVTGTHHYSCCYLYTYIRRCIVRVHSRSGVASNNKYRDDDVT